MPRFRYMLITEIDNQRVTHHMDLRVELEVFNYDIRGYLSGYGPVIDISCWGGKFALFRRHEDGKLVRILDVARCNNCRHTGVPPLASELEMDVPE